MKKLISMVVVFGLISTQIGCVSKITRISAPLDQVKFEKDYKYTVKLKTGEKTKSITGDELVGKSNQLVVANQQEKPLTAQSIESIDGKSTVRNGSYARTGVIIGGALGGGFGLLMGFALNGLGEGLCEGNQDCIDDNPHPVIAPVIGSSIGILAGGLVGLGIGAIIPKHNKVQITPVVSPTAQGGVDAGVNVGVKF